MTIFLFALFSYQLIGQIDINSYQNKFGEGETLLKKRINISFFYNEIEKQYQAKVSHHYEKLFIGNEISKGLVQVAFNDFQKLNLDKARYFKLDSIGNKRLLENVKVKYADVKDYYINNIFYSDLKVKQFNCSVDLPEDYVVSYSYDLIYKDLKFLTTFYLQNIDESVEEVEISIKKNSSVSFSTFEFNQDEVSKTEDENYIKFKANNLKRFKPSRTSVSGNYYLPHIIISVSEVKTKTGSTKILKTTEDLYSWYKSLIGELKPNSDILTQLASSIVEGETDDSKKIEKIFKWVQNNIQYVAFENGIAGFKPAEAHEVAEVKFGDCKGMANLLVNLLNSQGFDARHTWLGTRSNNYNYSIPSLAVDNHMICALNYKDKFYYLDATSKSATWTEPPSHIEGKQVMVSNGSNYIIETVEKSSPKGNILLVKGKMDISQKSPKINLSFKLTGHFYRDFMNSITYASIITSEHVPYYFISDYLDGIVVDNVSWKEIGINTIQINVSGQYTNIAFGYRKKVFPFLDLLVYPGIYKSNTPIYIDYPQTINAEIEILNNGKLPKEFYTEQSIGNDQFKASYFLEKANGKVVVKQSINLNLLNTSIENKEDWNTFVDQITTFNNFPITYD